MNSSNYSKVPVFGLCVRKEAMLAYSKETYKAVVPLHDELARGTLPGILKQCGLSKEDLQKLMRKSNLWFLVRFS